MATELSIYLDALAAVRHMHQRLFDVLKDELDRSGHNIKNAVQALLLYRLGDQELSFRDVSRRGCYLGTNASYSLRMLAEAGLIHQEPSRLDRRGVRISLTSKGFAVCDSVERLFQKHIRGLRQSNVVSGQELADVNAVLRRLDVYLAGLM